MPETQLFQALGSFETSGSKLSHGTSSKFADVRPHPRKVLKYNIISYSPSKVTISGLEDNDYYNVLISLTFNEEIEGFNSTVNVTVVKINDRYYVCGLDNA